jgi:hypothetical protein
MYGGALMSNLEYYITHVFPTGFQSIRGSFRIWADLMTGNYKDYSLMWYDDPYNECYNWFWETLGEDETLPKEFLEHLMQLAEDVRTGKEKTYPMEDVMKTLKEWAEEDDE